MSRNDMLRIESTHIVSSQIQFGRIDGIVRAQNTGSHRSGFRSHATRVGLRVGGRSRRQRRCVQSDSAVRNLTPMPGACASVCVFVCISVCSWIDVFHVMRLGWGGKLLMEKWTVQNSKYVRRVRLGSNETYTTQYYDDIHSTN